MAEPRIISKLNWYLRVHYVLPLVSGHLFENKVSLLLVFGMPLLSDDFQIANCYLNILFMVSRCFWPYILKCFLLRFDPLVLIVK
jgi:hypothetical protein